MLSLKDFEQARQRIGKEINETHLTPDTKSGLHFKWENHQPTSSFKVRGALNKILAMEKLPQVLITGSAGNHGLAVSLAAQKLNLQARVYVPEKTPKIAPSECSLATGD